MVTGLEEVLLGVGLEKSLDGISTIRRFFDLGPRERLLALLWRNFGDQTQLRRSDFNSWTDFPELTEPIGDLLDGRRGPDAVRSEIAAALIDRLHRTPVNERESMAAEITEAIVTWYPLVFREINEFGPNVINKLNAFAANQDEIRTLLRQSVESRDSVEISEALLAGPVAHVGQEGNAELVQELIDGGRQREAAGVLETIAEALDDAGLQHVGEIYLSRAAKICEEDGDTETASRLIESVIWSRISRRTSLAEVSASNLERVLGNNPTTRAILACAKWPELPEPSRWLSEGIEYDDDPTRKMRFRVQLAQLELLDMKSENVLVLTESISPRLDDEGALSLTLDRIDALEQVGERAEADRLWDAVSVWADTLADNASRGRSWARCGYRLAVRGDLAGSKAAYQRSIAAWADAADSEEQVADSFFSLQAAELLHGEWLNVDHEARLIAASLRQRGATAAGQALRLDTNASAERIAGNLPNAHRGYWFALAEYRSMGSLQGVRDVASRLAELYESTGHRGDAVRLYVEAGKGKEAAALANQTDASAVASVLSLGGAQWQRSATYSVLAALGPAAPVDVVAAFTDQLLNDAALDPPDLFHGAPAESAKKALAGVAFQIHDTKRDRAFAQLSRDVTNERMLDVAKACADVLARATYAGLVDCSELLVELFLGGRVMRDIGPEWIAEIIRENDAAREQVVNAARAGNIDALEALVFSGHDVAQDGLLVNIANKEARSWAEVQTHEVPSDGDTGHSTHHIGIRLELGGLIARFAETGLREVIVDRMLAIAGDDLDSELSRASAINALFNLSPSLDDDQLQAIAESVCHLAHGEYERLDIDRDHTEPLSRFQMRHNAQDQLHAASIRLLGRLRCLSENIVGVAGAIESGLAGSARLIGAALEAIAWAPDAVDGALTGYLEHDDPGVRTRAIDAIEASSPRQLVARLEPLADDSNFSVRCRALMAADKWGDTRLLRRMAQSDPDAYVRTLAYSKLSA